jgi:hypothetical protein
MIALVRKFWADDTGATAIEYELIAAGIFAREYSYRERFRHQAEHQVHVDQYFTKMTVIDLGTTKDRAHIFQLLKRAPSPDHKNETTETNSSPSGVNPARFLTGGRFADTYLTEFIGHNPAAHSCEIDRRRKLPIEAANFSQRFKQPIGVL